MATLVDQLLTGPNGLVAAGVYFLIKAMSDMWPAFRTSLAKRFKPGASIVLSIAGVYGVRAYGDVAFNHGEIVLLGIILGSVASHTQQVLKHTALGNHKEVEVDHKTGKRKLSKRALLIEQVRKVLT